MDIIGIVINAKGNANIDNNIPRYPHSYQTICISITILARIDNQIIAFARNLKTPFIMNSSRNLKRIISENKRKLRPSYQGSQLPITGIVRLLRASADVPALTKVLQPALHLCAEVLVLAQVLQRQVLHTGGHHATAAGFPQFFHADIQEGLAVFGVEALQTDGV